MISALFAGRERGARGGFVLLATLWLIVAVGAVSLALAVTARRAVEGSRNRINERVAYWSAVGCLARADAALNDVLASQPRITPVQASPLLQSISGCELSVAVPSATLDINTLTAAQSRALAVVAGVPGAQVDSVAAAIGSAQLHHFTSDSAIGRRARTLLRRTRLLRFLSVDSVAPDPTHSPREVLTVLALADGARSGVDVPTAPRPPPPDSSSSGEWWIVVAAREGDPPVRVVIRAKIVSFGGSFGVKEYRVE